MKVEVRRTDIAEVDADLLVVGLHEGAELPAELASARGAGDAKPGFKRLALLHPERPRHALVVGLGRREEMDAERARVAAALAMREAGRLEATSLAWLPPESDDDAATAAALVTGTILAAYRFDRFRSRDPDDPPPPSPQSLTLLAPEGVAAAAEAARVCAEAQNRARDLQSLPSNVATPSYLAKRAEEIAAANKAVSVEVLGREEIAAKKMGGLVAVSKGTAEEPKLIVLRYAGAGSGPTLGLVGKGVTFDTGGISLKSAGSMHEMKMDMSGAAAVLEAVAAIAELGLAVDLIAVVPSTENMPSGTASQARRHRHPAQRQDGRSQQHRRRGPPDPRRRALLRGRAGGGADRRPRHPDRRRGDRARLDLRGADLQRRGAGRRGRGGRQGRRGELVWRLPLHPEYKELTKGTVADLTNASAKRKAGTIYAGSFLEEFVDDTPWAHVDIAGTAWDVGREYTGKDASGYGVRLLVDLARRLAA